MSDGIGGLVVTLAIGYVIYRMFIKDKRRVTPRLGVLQGGRHAPGQFQSTANGPPESYNGVPQISVLSWPNAGDCKC